MDDRVRLKLAKGGPQKLEIAHVADEQFDVLAGDLAVEAVDELAGVLAATCLAGEVSFYSAIVAGEFDAAHWNATHKKA